MASGEGDSDEEIKARRKRRALYLGIALGVLVAIIYAMSIVRMGGNIFQKAPM